MNLPKCEAQTLSRSSSLYAKINLQIVVLESSSFSATKKIWDICPGLAVNLLLISPSVLIILLISSLVIFYAINKPLLRCLLPRKVYVHMNDFTCTFTYPENAAFKKGLPEQV